MGATLGVQGMEIDVRGKDVGELERLLGLFEAGKLSGALTVARLLLVSRDVPSIERWLLARVATCNGVRNELLHLIEQHRHGCQCVAALREGHAAEGGRQRTLGAAPPLAAPEAGTPDRTALAEGATRELVERFDAWGLLGSDRRTLGLGCGPGRMQAALSPRVALAAGVDPSPELVARARWCCSRLPNTRHDVADSTDLSIFDDASFQLLYAVDPVSSIVSSCDDRVKSTLAEVARVLAPGGDFVIVEPVPRPAQAGDVERWAREHGLEQLASEDEPLRYRGGVSYRMRRRA
jgi:SAM-dependent methyltransferase